MESPGMGPDSVTSGIKRRVKDKRVSKTTLNVSLASKIKTKIINNSSIFKISLKHNNRALAQALSREKENARRIATEKMLLQKEVEKLNFENTFLRIKLDNLNKKLIEIESLLSNNLITAIEMSSLSEFHQTSFLPSNSKKKRPSKQCTLIRLPFARVPLPSNDDEEVDKEKTPWDSSVTSRVSPDAPSSVSESQSAPTQCNVDTLFLKENNWNMCGLDDSEHISSSVDVPPKESHSHSDRSSQPAVVGETTNAPGTSCVKEKLSLSNVTARKKRVSAADTPPGADSGQQQSWSPEFGWPVETEGCADEKNIAVPRNAQGLPGLENPPVPSREPAEDRAGRAQDSSDPWGQVTVFGADMELTATDVSTIVAVSRGGRRGSNRKINDCKPKAFRKVRDGSSETKRDRPKRKRKISAGVDAEEKAENGPEGSSALAGNSRDSRDPDFTLSTAQLPLANPLRKMSLQHGSGQEDRHSAQCSGEDKEAGAACPQEEARGGGVHMHPNSLACSSKSKVSRQTFVIPKLEEDHLVPNQADKETINENLEVAPEFRTADLSSRENGNLCDCETQNMLALKKYVTNRQPAQQDRSEVSKFKQKVNRKTEVISQVNQRYGDNGKDVHAPQQRNIFFQTLVDKETVSGNLGISEDFQIPILFMRDHGNLCDCENQNMLDLQKPVTVVYPVQQNESKINKNLRQKVNRKTEIISEVNHFDNDKCWSCSEKGNLLCLQKERETLPGDLKDSSEFQTPALPTQDSGKPCDYVTQNASRVREQVRGVPAACQRDSKTGVARERGYQNTEIISEPPHPCMSRGRGLYTLEKDDFVSLTQKDEETPSANPEVTHEFQTVDLPTKDHRNLCDYETQNSCVTSMQFPQQNESKTNKTLRQKVNRKTEIISKTIQTREDIDNDVHGRKRYSEDLDFKINKSKPRPNHQGLIRECYMEINSTEKENYDRISDPTELVKKRRKKSSGKTRSILTSDQRKLALLSSADSQTPASPEYGLTRIGSGPDSATRRPRSTTPDAKGNDPWVEAREAGQCQATEVTMRTSRAKQRKASTALRLGSPEAVAVLPQARHRRPAGSEHTDQENHRESKRTDSAEPDFHTELFRPFSQRYSPDTQGASSDGIPEGSMPMSVSSGKILITEDHSAPERSPLLQVLSDGLKKTKEVRASVGGRAQKPETGNRTLQDLTNTSFFSSKAAKSESELGDGASKPPSRKRRCTPLSLREPSLKRKMRR
ncbi:shugoshin 2 [Heterocephalus glaber]|uniref:Shugoshin 2 n=1 Tax=Heterocephalus glaber TaxID=10181 RepID=A0AAX6SCK8_HETGA|nr:shugoshin 2 [Heterocephalus glaber]XP_021105445.1 shugoshin 2 [Heterocephalus glaber]